MIDIIVDSLRGRDVAVRTSRSEETLLDALASATTSVVLLLGPGTDAQKAHAFYEQLKSAVVSSPALRFSEEDDVVQTLRPLFRFNHRTHTFRTDGYFAAVVCVDRSSNRSSVREEAHAEASVATPAAFAAAAVIESADGGIVRLAPAELAAAAMTEAADGGVVRLAPAESIADEYEDALAHHVRQTKLRDDDAAAVHLTCRTLQSTGLASLCNFDVVATARKFYANIAAGVDAFARGDKDYETQMFGGGLTQTRKTLLILLVIMLQHSIELPSLVLGRFRNGRDTLDAKLAEYLTRVRESEPFSKLHIARVGQGAGLKTTESIADVFRSHGAVIISDSQKQLDDMHNALKRAQADPLERRCGYARQALPDGRYGMVIDEADAILRSGNTLFDKAYDALRHACGKPVCTSSITATLIPNLALANDPRRVTKDSIAFTVPPPDYVGLDMYRPFKMRIDGEERVVFLDEDELCMKTRFTSPKVMALHKEVSESPRALLIQMCTSKVNVEGNMREVAAAMQGHFPTICAIVAAGAGCKYRVDDGDAWTNAKDKDLQKTIAEVQLLTRSQRPIAVFTYATGFRAVSIRSDDRVPTHLVISITKGYAMENVFQALGRGTGECREQLHANGFEHVTVLTKSFDYDSCKREANFMRTVGARLEAGCTLQEAWSVEFDDSCNFTEAQRRSIGPASRRLKDRVPAEFELAFDVNAQEGRRYRHEQMNSALAGKRKRAGKRDFACPCGCGEIDGCPCGCTSAEEHVQHVRDGLPTSVQESTGSKQLLCVLMGMPRGTVFTKDDIKAIIEKHAVRATGVNTSFVFVERNLTQHLNGGGCSWKYGRILVKDGDVYTVNPVYWM